jgi:hypothetical protein
MIDEGTNAFFAIRIFQQWHWNLFFDYNHLPPLYFWFLAFFFKIFSPSLFSLWFFPALLSVFTLLLGFSVLKRVASSSYSLLWTWTWAFSFWPLYISRFCIPPNLIPLWECFCVLIFISAFPMNSNQPSRKRLILLGTALGIGFYIFFNWPLVALILLAAVGWSLRSVPQIQKRFGYFFLTVSPLLLVTLPLVVAYLHLPKKLDYFSQLWTYQKDLFNLDYFKTTGSFITALLWGADTDIKYFAYKPLCGGFLNPILGALFFIGLAEIVRERNQTWARWWGGSCLLFILPIFLTKNLEMFRIIEILPLILFTVVLGFQALLVEIKGHKRVYVLCLLMICSFCLDFYHLDVVYPNFWKSHTQLWDSYAKQRQCYDAFQVLDKLQKTRGPGLVLNEFTVPLEMDSREQSLNLACYPFDAYQNPKWGFEKAHWAALFVETPDIPYFHQHFPDATWYDLGPAIYQYIPNQPYSYKMVIFPVTAQNKNTLHRWANANYFLQGMIYQSLCPISTSFRRDISRQMDQNYSLFQGDPFLESHYWITLAGNLQRDNNLDEAWKALQQGLKQGYPDPQKCYLLGFFLFKAGQYDSARAAYLAAAKFDSRFMPPESALKELNRLADNNKRSSSKQNKIKAE